MTAWVSARLGSLGVISRLYEQAADRLTKQPPKWRAGTRESGAKDVQDAGGKDGERRRIAAIAATSRGRRAAVQNVAIAAGMRERTAANAKKLNHRDTEDTEKNTEDEGNRRNTTSPRHDGHKGKD